MSVPTGDRDVAEPEYIQNARQLAIYTLQKTKKWPLRWRSEIAQDLNSDVKFVLSHAMMGRKIWPTCASEAQLRREYFLLARAKLSGFIAWLEIACEIYPEAKKALPAWSAMAAREIKLLNGVLESDRKRFRFEE